MAIIDTTLREGQQRYGVYLDLEQKRDILLQIAGLGVEEIEIGVVGRDSCVTPLYEWAWSTLSCKLSVWSTCREKDIRAAAELMPQRLSICVPVSDAHLTQRLGTDRKGLIKSTGRALQLAARLGLPYISLGLEDISRADLDFALEVANLACKQGVSRLRLADTVGIWNPVVAADMVKRFKDTLDRPVGVHCHNDFGMATANSVASLMAGADFADASLLGLGERAGLAVLEELVAYLHFHTNSSYHVDGLPEMCRNLASLLRLELSAFKPITGEHLFYCETGLHVDGLYKSPELYEPYAPEKLGHVRKLSLGAKSGLAAVKATLNELGSQSTEELENLVSAIREQSTSLGRPLSPKAISEIVNR